MTLTPERQTLLNQKSKQYVDSMESGDSGIDYRRIDADRLLVLEALNDWSGQALAEGGDVKLTYNCDDPCCSTLHERSMLSDLMHKQPVILYPVSGFNLSEADDLRFSYSEATYRMMPHVGGSRADGVRIAESSHVRNVDLAMQLWVTSAVEACVAYLFYQMDAHNLFLEEDERTAVRSIIASAIQDRFSPGQVWNAIWRSVRDAAALSTRQYYNNAKAAKTIPKKLDSILAQAAASSTGIDAFDRIAAVPLSAVLTLFLHRFGITDRTTGAEVRAKLTADADLSPPADDGIDEEFGLVMGRFFVSGALTPLDKLILSCFKDINIDDEDLESGDGNLQIKRINFSLKDFYAFDGATFSEKLFPMLGVSPPTDVEIEKFAAAAELESTNAGGFVDASGKRQAFEAALITAGVSPKAASSTYWLAEFPHDPADVLEVAHQLPLESSIIAFRQDSAHVYGTGAVEHSSSLSIDDLRIAIPEVNFEPIGNDETVIIAAAQGRIDTLGEVIGNGLCSQINWNDAKSRAQLLRAIAKQFVEEADRLSTPPSGN
ncbi:hypothetical protein [Burkholderia cepacia]|uniref:hypothetical protein n=1 Tax=Burkholderia cepacia TaxID=292 RepID=UPI00264FE294|nr:hypothetical protein [Burkholderia cepacia]MDN7616614.1 hypothetical protein [Burkholderia cepacia]